MSFFPEPKTLYVVAQDQDEEPKDVTDYLCFQILGWQFIADRLFPVIMTKYGLLPVDNAIAVLDYLPDCFSERIHNHIIDTDKGLEFSKFLNIYNDGDMYEPFIVVDA